MKKIAKFVFATTEQETWAQKLQNEIQEIFPKSFVRCIVDNKSSFGGVWITLQMTLGGKGETEVTLHNDPMYGLFFIQNAQDRHGSFPSDGTMPEKIMVDTNIGGSLHVKPDQPSMYAYERVKLNWRKKTGTPDVVAQYIVNYFKKAKEIIKENKERLPEYLKNKI